MITDATEAAWRNTLAAMTALAIVVFAFFPLMPPRLLDAPQRGPDLGQLEAAFKAGAEVLVFSTPNNPTGVVTPEDTITEIARLAAEHNVTVIVDQLYSRLRYSGETYTHMRACAKRPEVGERSIGLAVHDHVCQQAVGHRRHVNHAKSVGEVGEVGQLDRHLLALGGHHRHLAVEAVDEAVLVVDRVDPHHQLAAHHLQPTEEPDSNLYILWGHNPDQSDFPLKFFMRKNLKKGAKLVVIDPKRIPLADKADMYLRVRPGSDGALALALMNVIIAEDLYDRDFVEKYSTGFDKLVPHVEPYTPEWAAEVTWIAADDIRALDKEARKAGVTVLKEVGLDPGIDHMSAMRIIDRIGRAVFGKTEYFEPLHNGEEHIELGTGQNVQDIIRILS